MGRFKEYLLFIAFAIAGLVAKSQIRSFSFQHYGPEEGLSNTNVFAIKQDKNNIIYLATENGVYNFDGYDFNKIKPVNPLKSNYIRNIGFDQSNQLLIINRREGIYQYNKLTNLVSLLKELNFPNSVDELVYDDDYYYALTDQISVSSINRKTGKVTEDEVKSSENENQAFALFKTSRNVVLLGRSDGLYQFENGKQIKLPLGNKLPVYSIAEDSEGMLYLGSDNAILCVKDNKIVKRIPVKTQKASSFFGLNNSAHVSKLIIDKYNRIWFTNFPDDNLYLIENNITYDAFDLLGIDKVLINCIYKDTDDHIWIGTFNDGVYFIQNPAFHNISFTSGRKILPVNCAAIIENNIVVGTLNGMFIFDRNSNNSQEVITPDELFLEATYGIYPDKKEVVYTKINSTSNTKRSFLINSSYYNFSPVAARVFSYSNNKEAVLGDGTANLLRIKDYTKDKYTVLDTLISFPDYRTRINCLYETEKTIFVGTSDGLTLYDKARHSYTNFTNQFFSYAVNAITNFNHKTYLAHENGITAVEDSALIQQIGEQRLTAVKKLKYYNNKIWIATLDGLFICDTSFNPVAIYNRSNGLLSNTINDIVFENDQCCICSNKGITLCNINELINQKRIANKLFINNIIVNDEVIDFRDNSIRLKSNQSDVTINFSSPLYVKPNKQQFKYKLDNSKWVQLENRTIRLTSVSGGAHVISIICSYDGINWSEPLNINLKKDIPFTETIWFVLSIIGGAALVILLIIYVWVKNVRSKATKRVQEERQVNLLKHQAMNSLMSPHFIFNSLTSIQNYINANDSLKASEYLAKFSRLIRMIIEKASQGEIVLHEELTRLNYYLELEKERFKGKFDFSIEVDPSVNTLDIRIPNMIIQPYAENSIIHGILPKHQHGNLWIRFKKENEKTLLIIIEDNGIGFNKARENAKAGHKSLGTKTIENILELNTKLTGRHQKVEIKDKSDLTPPQEGTIITIRLQID